MKHDPQPPRWAGRLLQRFVPGGNSGDGLIGDLEELYRERRAAGGRLRADLWYVRQALSAALRYQGGTRQMGTRLSTTMHRPGGAPLQHAAAAFRLATRRLVHAPGFTAAAVITLALGFGGILVVFTVVHAVALKPLPYPDDDRLVVIEHPLPGFESGGEVPTLGGLLGQQLHYEQRSRTLVEVGGYWVMDTVITEPGDPASVRIGVASAGFFRALGISPAYGRLFHDEEPVQTADVRGAAVLGQGIWRQRFDGDAAALGRLLETSGFAYEVVGVLPRRAPFPPEHAELWSPIQRSRMQDNPNWTVARMIGRMAPGVGAEDVKRELDGLIAELPDRFSEAEFRRAVDEGRMEAEVTPLQEWLIGEVEQPLWLLLGAAAVVLAIAAINVAGLVAVRTESQRRELAVRAALGAGRGRIGGHFVAEALLLSLLAGVLGSVLAAAATTFGGELSVVGVPRLDDMVFDVEAAGLAAVLVLASTALLSAASVAVSGRGRATTLAGHGRTASPGRARLRAYNLLVASQLALSVILLAGAGLVIGEAVSLARLDTGFEVDGVLTLHTPFPFEEIQNAEPGTTATPFYDMLAERLLDLPGVTAVGYGNCLPLSPDCTLGGTTLRREDQPEAEGALPVVGVVRASPGYLEALGVPLLAGRSFERTDHERGRGVVLVNAGLAERFWPDGIAIGNRLVQDGREGWGALEVVGIVGDVRFDDLRGAPEAIAYLPVLGPVTPTDLMTASWVIRTALPATEVAPAARREVDALRPDVPVADVATLADVTAGSTARLRIVLWLLTMASAIAITLSGVGVYGVVAYVASTRRGELGIRLALGAQTSELRALVMRQGIIAALAGLAVGAVAAVLMGRAIAALAFGVARPDVPTLLAVLAVLGATAVVAAWLPARRASRLDPAEVMSSE